MAVITPDNGQGSKLHKNAQKVSVEKHLDGGVVQISKLSVGCKFSSLETCWNIAKRLDLYKMQSSHEYKNIV
jgi:hypothetical protein